MIEKLRQTIEHLPAFGSLLAADLRDVTITGVAGSLGALIVAGVRDRLQRQIVLVARDQESAERFRDDLALVLGGDSVSLFSGTRARGDGHRGTSTIADIQALRALQESPTSVIVTHPRGIAVPLPRPAILKASAVQITSGESTDLAGLVKHLRDFGFEQKDFVESHGDFALRGGILDVFTFAGENPVRIEFVNDGVESIREFDPLSQRSIRQLGQATILPDLFDQPAGGILPDRRSSLIDHASDNLLLVMEEPELIRGTLESRNAAGDADLFTYAEISEITSLVACVAIRGIVEGGAGMIDFGARPQPAFNGSIAMLQRDLSGLQSAGYWIAMTCDSQGELSRLKDLLALAAGSPSGEDEPPAVSVEVPRIEFSLEALHEGFVMPADRVAVYTEHQVFSRLKRRGRKRAARFAGLSEREVQKLRRGDYVVHQDFGIGRFDGMKRINIGGAEQEVVKIQYEARDTLFVNLNYVNKLQKYSSKEGHIPTLSRLGSGDWDRLRTRAKKRVKDIARDLIALYARRKQSAGFAFSPDTLWQKELEASFMYEDTFDQAKATVDVKRDMEAPHPMDRLICGDVGFGKTEVAVRAAFKAVMDGKQVAVLVPTTILATQHANTFRDRLGRYGVRLDVLSRFRSKKEQAETASLLGSGSIDIMIGTHRILSKDVTFRNLGLLIVDEEHRFGVAAKEKLRQMRTDVDTLSLTATPIPRTLHFSLMGARDLSIIATPPRNRLPVVTEILQWNDDIIRDAVRRELQRGGQVYFVHDRVHTMEEVTARLRKILPDVQMRAAHGQMSAHLLEEVMMAFLEKRCDMLVATKIIESGLDIPNVNTIVINQADRFGMAELYQLRGRVGRSNVQAYAYLLTPPVSVLPKGTVQRLQAVEEFTELGSGFNLAMRDLEIRGAGNLLGAEQSGFIETMGFETYTRVLEEAVQELKDEEFKDLFAGEQVTRRAWRDAAVETDLDAFIPESYVRGDAERLALYRQLYALTTPGQLLEVRGEMEDRFGKLPPEIDHLFGMVRLRLAAAAVGFVRISIHGEMLEAEFPPETDSLFYESEMFQAIMSSVARMKSQGAVLRQAEKTLKLQIRNGPFSSGDQKLAWSLQVLRDLTGKELIPGDST